MQRMMRAFAMVLAAAVSPAGGAEPDLLRAGNLKILNCAAPDTKYVLVGASQPGNVFYPGEPVDLRIKVTRGDEPLSRVRLEIIEIATRENRYLEGMSTMTPPPQVENLGVRGGLDVPVAIEDKPGAAAEIEARNVPVPQRYGTYLITLAPNGRNPQFLCTLIRAHRPADGWHVDFPVFGEGQFITHDSAKPEHVALRARTLSRLGIGGVRIELGWSEPRPGEHDFKRFDLYLNALEEARVKALVTMGGHPYWTMPFGQPTPACIPEKPDHSCMPKHYDAFERWIEAFCRRYWKDGNGALWAIEHWNEPWEGISISGWESDSNHYRELMKRIAAACRRVDRRIKTAAACSIMNTEDKFLCGDNPEKLIELVDLFTDHYVPPRTSYGPMVARYWNKESTDTESWIAATEVLLPQVMCQFLACGQDRVTPWHPAMTYFSVPGSPYQYHMPNPVALASNVFNCMIGQRKFRRLMFLDHLPWAFVFGPDDDAVVVFFGQLMPLWGSDVSAYRDLVWWQTHLEKGGTITIDNSDGALEFYDIAGNRELEGMKEVRLPADYLAHYIRSPRGGLKVIAERLNSARLEGLRPVEIIARDFTTPLDAPGAVARVTLHNLLNRPIAGKLTITPPASIRLATGAVDVRLEAGQTADFAVPVVSATPSPANAYPFAWTFESDAGKATWQEVMRVTVAKRGSRKIDGNLDDWKDDIGIVEQARARKADATEQAWLPFVEAQTKQPDGTFGEVKMAWDDTALYLAARVHDPGGHKPHLRLANWDEDQYFRSARDDAICEMLRPFEKFIRIAGRPENRLNPQERKLLEEARNDPAWGQLQKLMNDNPEVRHAVTSNAARVYLEAKKRDAAASFADASHVYKKVPWDDAPWAGDVLQFGFDVMPGYEHHRLKADTDRVPEGFHAMPDTDYEYAAYACADGGAELWRLLAPGVPRGHHYPRQPRAKFDQGPVPGGQCVVKREGNITIYELAIPWTELRQFKPAPGRTFGFTFRINNAGGSGNAPPVIYGLDKSATKTNGLSLHPYWEGKPSCGIRWAMQ